MPKNLLQRRIRHWSMAKHTFSCFIIVGRPGTSAVVEPTGVHSRLASVLYARVVSDRYHRSLALLELSPVLGLRGANYTKYLNR